MRACQTAILLEHVAIGLLGSVKGRFSFSDSLQLVLLVLGGGLDAEWKAEFAAKDQNSASGQLGEAA